MNSDPKDLTFELPALMNSADSLTDAQLRAVAGGVEDTPSDEDQKIDESCNDSCWFNSC